jgi:hypothetical protein
MANTFTDNYNFIKSEIGGDNASWGTNLHTSLTNADTALAKKVEDQLISGITSTAILLSKDNSANTISTDANLKYFESVKVGDRIRVSGSAHATNGTAANPVIHYVTAKTSADSITVNNNLTQDIASNTEITVAKVLEPVHINSGPIVCAPLTSLSHTTRATNAACVGEPGADTTDALVANGDVTLGSANTDTVTFTAKIATDVLPSAADLDLGASGSQWEDLWIDGTANIDSLVADTAAISGGSITGGTGSFTTLAVGSGSAPSDGTTINMTGYTIGTNGQGTRTVSNTAPSSPSNGDIWYEIA